MLEDGFSRVRAVISPDLWEAHRVLLRDARALIICGKATARGRAVTVRVERLCELPLGQVRQTADRTPEGRRQPPAPGPEGRGMGP